MKSKLEQLEERLKQLIEVSLLSVFPGFKLEELVARKLTDSVRNNLLENDDGSKLVPNVFTLVTNPQDTQHWQNPTLITALISSIEIAVRESGLVFSSTPTISIVQNPAQPKNQVEILASHQVSSQVDTAGMTPALEPNENIVDAEIPKDAFLIIDGVKVFPLDKSVINIGRRRDNHLVIDDPRVSRSHAQIRAVTGRFVIFDLQSTGGTFVNGQRVGKFILYPGDVISLAGVSLIFGQDNPPSSRDLSRTGPLKPVSVERPTAYFQQPSEDDEDRENSDL